MHYARTLVLVRKKETTWADLEAQGKSLPAKTKHQITTSFIKANQAMALRPAREAYREH